MCHTDDYVYEARRDALETALRDRGLPDELCTEVCGFVPPSPLCACRAFELLTPDHFDALDHLVLVDGQQPLTVWHSESGQHSMTVTRQRLTPDPLRRLVYVETREYDVRISPKASVKDWYAYDDSFVTILAEVEEPGGDTYTLLYHPYCFWEDGRVDLCGIMEQTPELMQLLHDDGVALRSDMDWGTRMDLLAPDFWRHGSLLTYS
jgi:hypothetical protein